jgi:hypothetical protein
MVPTVTSLAPYVTDPNTVDLEARINFAVKTAALAHAGGFISMTKEQAAYIVLKGLEMNIPATVSLGNLYVVPGSNGKNTIGMTTILMHALARKTGELTSIDIPNVSDVTDSATVTIQRGDAKPVSFTFTLEQAKKLGLLNGRKFNWNNMPELMLIMRAIAGVIRLTFPEVIIGLPYTIEELEGTHDTIRLEPDGTDEFGVPRFTVITGPNAGDDFIPETDTDLSKIDEEPEAEPAPAEDADMEDIELPKFSASELRDALINMGLPARKVKAFTEKWVPQFKEQTGSNDMFQFLQWLQPQVEDGTIEIG